MSWKLLAVSLLSFSLASACGTGNNAESNTDTSEEQAEPSSSSSEEASAPSEENQEEEESAVSHHDDLPYTWKGTYHFQEDTTYTVTSSSEEPLTLGFIREGENIEDLDHHAAHMMEAEDMEEITDDTSFQAEHEYAYRLKESDAYTFTIEAGTYAVFSNQDPTEEQVSIQNEQEEAVDVQGEEDYNQGEHQEDTDEDGEEHTHDDETHSH